MKNFSRLPLIYRVDYGNTSDVFVYNFYKHQHFLFGTYKKKNIKIGRNGEWICERTNYAENGFDIIPHFADDDLIYPLEDHLHKVKNYEVYFEGIVYCPHLSMDWSYVDYKNKMRITSLGEWIIPGVFLKGGASSLTMYIDDKFVKQAYRYFEVGKFEVYTPMTFSMRPGVGNVAHGGHDETVDAILVQTGKTVYKLFCKGKWLNDFCFEFNGKKYSRKKNCSDVYLLDK